LARAATILEWQGKKRRASRQGSNDTLKGGPGDDVVYAGQNNDQLRPGSGARYGASAPIESKRSAVKQNGGTSKQTEPAIEWIDSEGYRADAIEEFYQSVITELGKRFLER
jgi:hypothetical protein